MHLPYKFKKLDIAIDVASIRAEIEQLECPWGRHGFHETGHDVIPLLSTNGVLFNADGTRNNALVPPFLPTEFLQKMPRTRDIIYSFGIQPQRVRIAKMKVGDIINPHRDLHPNWYNKVRVHIPIDTNEDVRFHVWEMNDELRAEERTDFHMSAGNCWILDTWRVHAVTNFSNVDRTHLIIDLEPRGRLFEAMFDDVSEPDMRKCLSYEYPRTYSTDSDTLQWLTAGQLDVGVQLWNTSIVSKNPQVGKYKHHSEFWK
ncbi:aspartyl/asparaginyl beta-hydroxylase domain-containing protein [Paraburkholderia sp. Se-20369]|nr:aspartyl/asparaginyl beta-hydroxylase domain-containing protein [Paraburkholderia sp. Se-20369]TCW84321.1 hypothetical protein C5O80_14865 [Burkholderia sp. SRS-46]